MALIVPFEWIQNHFAAASRIAHVMQQSIKEQGCEPGEFFILVEARNLWPKFAEVAGCKKGYDPSVETRLFVRELVSYRDAWTCTGCNVRKAEYFDSGEQRAGTEICPACWKTRYPAAKKASAA